MYGISSSGKDSIANHVDKMFDVLAYKLLGRIPKLQNKPHLFQTLAGLSLAHIFLQSMGNKDPNQFERDALRSILSSSHGYIESLKNKTSSNVVESIDALVKEAKANGTGVDKEQVNEVFSNEMTKARAHMKLIAEAETTKTRNIGHTMEIAGNAKNMGIEDPTCFFVIVRDNKTCLEENEPISTVNGVSPIGQIKVGDLLKNPSTPSQRGGNRVISVEKQQKETIELDFGDKRIICTKDHPILIRFGKILCFMEADRITEEHDVVLAHEIVTKGDLKMISRAKTPRSFMKKLGYSDAWDFWRENIDDILAMAKKYESRVQIMKKYGINIAIWDQYVIHILKGYDKTIKLVGKSPNNNFNTDHATRKSKELKLKRQNIYDCLGGDKWFVEEITKGKNCKDLAKENGLNIGFLSTKIKPLGLLPIVKSKGGRANWNKNREHLIQLGKTRGTPHFNSISKPQLILGEFLSRVYTDIEGNFIISNMKVDFCIPSIKLVIEYDGSGHTLRDRLVGNKTDKITNQTDFSRDKIIKGLGFRIFRIKAPKDIFDPISIIDSINNFIASEKVFGVWQNL